MTAECCEISWVAFGILFAFTQGIIAIILASSPQDDDKAIQYTRHITMPKNVLVWVSGISLVSVLAISWVYFITNSNLPTSTNNNKIIDYIIALAITILGLLTFAILCVALHRIWQIRLHPHSSIDYSAIKAKTNP